MSAEKATSRRGAGRRRRLGESPARRRTALLAWVGGVCLAGAALCSASAWAAPPAPKPELTLTGALAQALEEGPGFAAAALQRRMHALAASSEEAGAPVVDVSLHSSLQPALRPTVQGRLSWPLTDDVSLLVTATGSGDGSGSAGGELSVRFERTFWPPRDDALELEIERLERRISELQARQAAFDAARAVVDAFYALRDASERVRVAERALDVATQRAAAARQQFDAGQLGSDEWLAAQRREREARVELRNARHARQEAAERLARLVSGSSSRAAEEAAANWLVAPLVDDFPWSDFIAAVRQALAEGEDAVRRRVLDNDVSYLNALQQQLEQQAAANEATRAAVVRWYVSAEYSASWPAAPGTGVATNAQAAIAGTLDLSRSARSRSEQAALALELARLRTEQMRQAALDGADAALRAVEDAAFALELASEALAQAEKNFRVTERRAQLGFAAPVELAEAELALLRARRDVLGAEAALRLGWLDVARRLDVPFPQPHRFKD